jgi:transposase InsO family protein
MGKNLVWRLTTPPGLWVKAAKRFKVTINSEHKRPVASNLVQCCFSAKAPNRLWTAEGWLYPAVVVDVFSRRIVGWSMTKRMTDELTGTAFKNALIRRQPASGLIFHSARGAQQCSNRFQSLLKGTGGFQSCSFRYRGEAQSRIFRYIETSYNRQRRHSAGG